MAKKKKETEYKPKYNHDDEDEVIIPVPASLKKRKCAVCPNDAMTASELCPVCYQELSNKLAAQLKPGEDEPWKITKR